MLKKRVLIVLIALIVISLLAAGCQKKGLQPGQEKEQDIHIGTKGLEMNFAANMPPNKIYSTGTLGIMVEMKNKGTYDLSGKSCSLFLSGFDESVFRDFTKRIDCGILEKKSLFNPEGGFFTREFISNSIELPRGIDSLPQKFVVTACYNYETEATPIICINPKMYDIRAYQEACTVQDVGMGGGQGAPVAVTNVKVDMLGKDRVSLKITVSNVGGGTSLSQETQVSGEGNAANSCPYNLEYDDINIVDYSVEMPGGNLVQCNPNIAGDWRVRLVNNQGTIICSFTVGEQAAYTTPVYIKLSYNYMDSISKTVNILKTPSYD